MRRIALTLCVLHAIGHGEPAPPAGADYDPWLRAQPRAVQLRIARFCSQHARSIERTCGGIGPLHIPPPPDDHPCVPPPRPAGELGPVGFGESAEHARWRTALTPEQDRYYTQKCREKDNSALCGRAPRRGACNTPLVVVFDDEPVELAPGARFAFAPGPPVATDWPTPRTPWLALDRDGDGAITSGAELFGDHSALPDGSLARDGFAALAALDANHDGIIDRGDPAFASLALWSAGELAPAARTIVSISLAARPVWRCDARDNCEGLAADLVWRDPAGQPRHGRVVDVYLPSR